MVGSRLFIALVSLLGGAISAQSSLTLKDAVVVEISELPPYTGLLRTWVRIGLVAKGRRTDFLYPYFEQSKLPNEGVECDVRYHLEDVDGQIGLNIKRLKGAAVIDELNCDKIEGVEAP